MDYKLDATDLRILSVLVEDARMSYIDLSRKLKVSNTLIHQRVRKLKAAGILKNATYRLDAWNLGYQSSAWTQIMLTDAKLHRKVEKELEKIPQVVECVNISGRYAILIKIYARDNRHLRDIIYEKIQPIEGVESTNTTMSFESIFSRNVPLSLEDD